ncbi:MAG: phosphoenolpyruvate carboxykinase (ATP), partial [Desulfobacteraceae bacterium]
HGANCWLVNTGWTGGGYGVGTRMKIEHTRALLNAALEGTLGDVDMVEDPTFGFQVPVRVPGVPAQILDPRSTWPDPLEYDARAKMLADLFHENFEQFKEYTPAHVLAAGPRGTTT